MTERKYSLSEIDQMREFFRYRLPAPFLAWSGRPDEIMQQTVGSLQSVERWNREAEDQLRTAMAAGVDPAECVIPSQQVA